MSSWFICNLYSSKFSPCLKGFEMPLPQPWGLQGFGGCLLVKREETQCIQDGVVAIMVCESTYCLSPPCAPYRQFQVPFNLGLHSSLLPYSFISLVLRFSLYSQNLGVVTVYQDLQYSHVSGVETLPQHQCDTKVSPQIIHKIIKLQG